MCIPKAAGERTANSDLSCLHTSFSLSTMSLSSVFSSFFQTVHADAPEEKEARLRLEAEARQISDRIDEQIKAERAALKKNRPVKVLLLGQSESGECPARTVRVASGSR